MTINEATKTVNDALAFLKVIRDINNKMLAMNDSWQARDVTMHVEGKAKERLAKTISMAEENGFDCTYNGTEYELTVK
jgi:hypothetical protein